LSWAKRICAELLNLTPPTATTLERIGHWIKMLGFLVQFSESEASNHTPSLADFTTTTSELPFSVHTTITPELLAALAQVERTGNPVARTYWRWQLPWNPFAVYKPPRALWACTR
jgi:hypothetical protein